MEVPELACPVSPARDPPAPAPGPPGAAGGQAPPHLALGPAILPPEQGRAPAVFLKALPIPLYHTVPPGGLQPRAPLVAGSLDGGGVPFLLSPLLQPEGPGPAHAGKPATPTLTVSIVGALPVLSPGPGPALGGLGKARHAGKYLCPHCGRDCLKPSVLEKHIRSHTGERPFPCATCGIAFKTQSNLYKHRRTQTHLNNSRLSSESDGAGGSLLEEGGRAGGAPRAAGPGGSWSPGRGDGAPSERPLSPGVQGTAHVSPVAKNVDLKLEAVCCPGSAAADGEARTASTGLSTAAGPQPRRPLPGQRSPPASRACSLPQQQAPPSEKPWDTKASEGRLRKCESTDSGYLSRSDSAEQPLAPSSPLHSLSEHSAESEGEAAPGPGGARAAPGGRGPSLELEKRQLEERIARLISHNQAVVDDPQLDHVRPRKTVLSKQGSIDLPMPYTYKDSFHFEIRAPEPGRRRPGAPRAARSTCTPLDKARPLFFHSVPTQLSATVECVPVTRSNSLPVVEGTRTWQEPPEPQDACPRRQKPLSPRPAAARLADVPSGHPRALVRQAAVEDLPCPPTRDTMTPREDPDGKKAVAGDEGAAGRGRAAGRRCSQRRLQMFSQERWRVYGRETFQRLYQKMRASRQGSRKAREVGAGCGAEQGLPPQEEAAGGEGAARTHGRRTPVCGDASVGAQPGPVGSPPAAEGSLVTESPKQRQTVATSAGEEQPRGSGAASPPRHCGEPPCLDGKSPVPPPRGSLEPGCPLPPAPGPLKGGDQEAPRLVLPDPEQEGGAQGGGDAKEPCQQALVLPARPCGSSGEPPPVEPPLPSERKKLRVEGPSGVELPGPLGAGGQAPAPPGQAASSPSWNQDGGPRDKPAGPHRSAECTARGRAGPPEASGAHFSASSVAPRPVGLRDKEPGLGPAAAVPGGRSPPLPQTQASDVPAAPTHTTFPPKYLLRLPQGETSPPQPGARGPLGGSGWPEDPASSAGSEPATLLPSLPDAGLAPGRADGCREGPSWSRLWGRGKRAPEEGRGDMDPNTPQAGASPGTAAVLPAWACGPQRTETRDAGHLRSGSTGASAQPPGAALNPWPLDKDLAEPPENVPEGPPPGPPAEHSPRCSLRPSSILSSAQLPAGWPGLAAGARSDSPGSGGPQGPFPSLRAEPRLTWCCLGRSLPLPAEQEKAASACWVPHRPGGCPPGQGADARPASKAASGRWTRTSPAEGGATRPWKLSYLTAPGGTSGDAGPEPAWKKGPPRRRAKPSRGSSKQKALRRYRGSFLQGRVQLRARRLRKPLWALRKDSHPPHGEGLDPRRTLGQAASETAELSLQGEPPCASAALSLGCGKGEEEEEDRRPTSGGASPSASSRGSVQDVTPSAGEHSDCSPQNTAVGSGLSLPPDSCVQVAGNSLLSRGRGLDVGFPETPRVPSQEQVSADAKPDIVSDAQEPASLEPKGNALCCDAAASGAAICPSLGARGGHTTLGAPGTEAQEPGRAAGDALTRGSPDSEATVQGTSLSLSPGRPSPGQRLSSLVPSRPPGKTHLEIPASGPGSTSSHQDAARPKALLPSGGRPGCGEMPVSCPPMGKDREKCHESGFRAPQDGVVPSKSGQPTEVSQAPSKTIKKRSLEGMRKQSRVELSDTSSDDEDRLVIEI
ncbi:zinc finger protein 831 [Pteronotus mesoamericanus]|uniref:zinc finger protein 831 n=1 Tax=Pteronotus mesoamericanus TaxID=1884717 RepID=UPI0023ECB498|nr:zinc finger protein 831 [Pteronotus parnellii mesoamericanus]